MSNIQHYQLVTANLHVASYTVADEAARLALAGTFIAADRGKLIQQLDDGTVWKCVAAGIVVFEGNNLSGEGVSVDSDGTVTVTLGDTDGIQKLNVADVNGNTLFSVDSAGALNIVCHDNEVVCHDNEVVLT